MHQNENHHSAIAENNNPKKLLFFLKITKRKLIIMVLLFVLAYFFSGVDFLFVHTEAGLKGVENFTDTSSFGIYLFWFVVTCVGLYTTALPYVLCDFIIGIILLPFYWYLMACVIEFFINKRK